MRFCDECGKAISYNLRGCCHNSPIASAVMKEGLTIMRGAKRLYFDLESETFIVTEHKKHARRPTELINTMYEEEAVEVFLK